MSIEKILKLLEKCTKNMMLVLSLEIILVLNNLLYLTKGLYKFKKIFEDSSLKIIEILGRFYSKKI